MKGIVIENEPFVDMLKKMIKIPEILHTSLCILESQLEFSGICCMFWLLF